MWRKQSEDGRHYVARIDEKRREADERPRRLELATEPLGPAGEPVGMLVRLGDPRLGPHAWVRGSNRLQPLPDLQKGPARGRDVLSAGGTSLLFERAIDSDEPSLPLVQRRRIVAICRLDFATGAVEPLTFEADRHYATHVAFAGSPDGQRVAVVECVPQPPRRQGELGRSRLTFWLAEFTSRPPVEAFVAEGDPIEGADDLSLQWSPNGRMIALSVMLWQRRPDVEYVTTLLLLDAQSGLVVDRLERHAQIGSLSWSPDSTRLLVESFPDLVLQEFEVSTGRLTPAVVASGASGDRVGAPRRMFGFADDGALLYGVQRGRTMAVECAASSGAQPVELLRWTADLDMYPVLARAQGRFWA